MYNLITIDIHMCTCSKIRSVSKAFKPLNSSQYNVLGVYTGLYYRTHTMVQRRIPSCDTMSDFIVFAHVHAIQQGL